MAKVKHKVVYVEWVDATASNCWTDIIDIQGSQGLKAMPAIGFVVKEDRLELVLAVTHDGVQTNGFIHIPKSCIVKRKNVKI